MRSNADSRPAPFIGAVIVCAGKGERTGLAYNKILHCLGHKTVIEHVLDAVSQSAVHRSVVVCAADDRERIRELVSQYDNVDIRIGGNTRGESVQNGLSAIPCDIVAILDGARPFVSPALIDASIKSAIEHGSGIAAVRSVDTVKRAVNGKITSLPRSELFVAQTPQTFRYDQITDAYRQINGTYTDDAEVYERAGFTPTLVDGEYTNIKITNASDLFRTSPVGARIGAGFDVHRLIAEKPLILGGVSVPFDRGLDGHSDADVLTHAIMDALLSAAGLPDIGVLFPDTDDRFLGISSMRLLDDVISRIDENFKINNISAVVMAQAPKLSGHIQNIRNSLAERMSIDVSRVNVSATTTEHMGIIGSGDAIAASATCLLAKKHDR